MKGFSRYLNRKRPATCSFLVNSWRKKKKNRMSSFMASRRNVSTVSKPIQLVPNYICDESPLPDTLVGPPLLPCPSCLKYPQCRECLEAQRMYHRNASLMASIFVHAIRLSFPEDSMTGFHQLSEYDKDKLYDWVRDWSEEHPESLPTTLQDIISFCQSHPDSSSATPWLDLSAHAMASRRQVSERIQPIVDYTCDGFPFPGTLVPRPPQPCLSCLEYPQCRECLGAQRTYLQDASLLACIFVQVIRLSFPEDGMQGFRRLSKDDKYKLYDWVCDWWEENPESLPTKQQDLIAFHQSYPDPCARDCFSSMSWLHRSAP